MSLQSLLADFPNYSARKVRRLARQLNSLAKVDPIVMPESKGIADDLMEYNLLQAKIEERTAEVAEAPPSEDEVRERISVTPHDAAMKALNTMLEYVRVNSDINVKGEDFQHVVNKCRGIINGQTFTTDRTYIQARLSPQDQLSLANDSEAGAA